MEDKIKVEVVDNKVWIDDGYNSDCLIVWSLDQFEEIVEQVKLLTNR